MSQPEEPAALQRFPPLDARPEIQESSISTVEDGLSLPPIYTSPSIITIQPSSISEERRLAGRSQEPPSHLDWVTAPRSQLGVFSGRYFMSSVDQLEIQRVVDLNSLLGKSRNGSQYRVRVPRSETIFLAIEDSKECQRTFLRSSRELTLNIMDPSGETAFVIKKSLSWGCLPGFLHMITVEGADYLGSVEQNMTVVGVSFTVYDDTRRPLCHIEGPTVYSCCISNETQFQIMSTDKSRQIASLIRHWDHFLVDYSVLLTFMPNTEAKLKGLLLGAAFLLDVLFFERQSR